MIFTLQTTESHNFPWHSGPQSYLDAMVCEFYLNHSDSSSTYYQQIEVLLLYSEHCDWMSLPWRERREQSRSRIYLNFTHYRGKIMCHVYPNLKNTSSVGLQLFDFLRTAENLRVLLKGLTSVKSSYVHKESNVFSLLYPVGGQGKRAKLLQESKKFGCFVSWRRVAA